MNISLFNFTPRMLRILAFAVGLMLAGTSQAYTITQIDTSGGNPGGLPVYEVSELVEGDIFELSWELDGSGTYGGLYPDLDASAIVTITSLTADQVVIDITLSNDTAELLGDPDLMAAITVFGFAIEGVDLGDPANMLSVAGSHLDTYDEGSIGGAFSIDVCASTDNKCNKGNPMEGIGIGENDSFQFTLNGTFDVDNLVLSGFGTKWQTNWDSIVEGEDNSSFELPGESPPIPEPSTALLLSLGLVGLGVAGRKR